MDWPTWRPHYEAILREFGFDRAADERARDLLADLAPAPAGDALRAALAGRDVVVLGPAPARVPAAGVLVTADAATTVALAAGRVPDVVVTDLDGPEDDLVEASRRGAILVVHAHGDNVPALRRVVPRLAGPVVATTQAEPTARVANHGGFTDGDRAVLLADAMGASSVTLVGFDFERPIPKPGRDARTKAAKLAWARRLIALARVPVKVA